MTVEELQNFIADNVHANVDDKIVGQIMSDAANMDFNSFTNKWDEFLQEHSAGWSTVKPNDKDIYTRLREAYGSSDEKNPFAVPENFSDEIYEEKFKDVPKNEYNNSLAKMKEFWDKETKERREQAGRTRRTKEIEKDWPWYKKLLANEYSQARYIDDPNSTPFGKEGKFDPFDNKLELANIGLQGASLAGDAIPGVWGYVAGPGLRLGNDVLQEAGDYGKDLKDIAYDRALDLGTSFIGEAGPNTLLRSVGRSEKLGKTLGRGIRETSDYADLLKQHKDMEAYWTAWANEPNKARRLQIINDIPDAGLKQRLEVLESTVTSNTPKNEMVKNFAEDYKIREPDEAADILSKGEGDQFTNPWLNKVSETPVPGKAGQAMSKVINSNVAQYPLSFVKRKTAGGVLANPNLSKPESKNDKALKESYKRTYAKDWLDLNFKPRENSGLMYEAWKELMEENGREVK